MSVLKLLGSSLDIVEFTYWDKHWLKPAIIPEKQAFGAFILAETRRIGKEMTGGGSGKLVIDENHILGYGPLEESGRRTNECSALCRPKTSGHRKETFNFSKENVH